MHFSLFLDKNPPLSLPVLLHGSLKLSQLLFNTLDHPLRHFLAGQFLPAGQIATQVIDLLAGSQAFLPKGIALPLEIPNPLGQQVFLPRPPRLIIAEDVLEFVEGRVLLLLLGGVLVLAVVLDVDQVLV